MNFHKIFLCLICFLITIYHASKPLKITSIGDVISWLQDNTQKWGFLSKQNEPIKFIVKYYENNPLACLSRILRENYIPLERVFLVAISSTFLEALYYEIDLNSYPNKIKEDIMKNCSLINLIVAAIFYKTNLSEKEMQDKFSIIKLYIKFAERYIEYPGIASSPDYTKKVLQELPSNVEAWKFAIRTLPTISPNGIAIDYEKFFNMFYWILRPNRLAFPKYNESDLVYSNYQFLFITLVHRMITLKDLELYKFVHPELPFLVGFLLNNVNEFGEWAFPKEYFHSQFYPSIEECFESKGKLKSLTIYLFYEKHLVKMAKIELGLDICKPYPTSLLVDSLERLPFLCQSKRYQNILWQLKGYVYIKEFLKTSKFRKTLK